MRFDEIPATVDRLGDELGWDDEKRTAKRAQLSDAKRRMLQRPETVVFLPFQRRLSAAERLGNDAPGETRGVTVRDTQGGAEYDVVLDDRGRLIYYAVRAIDGILSDVNEWPRDVIAALARQQASDSDDDPIGRDEAFGAHTAKERRPPREYIAALIREAAAGGMSPQAVIAAKTGRLTASGRPSSTVDRWVREARAADPTLPQATRHPQKRTNDGTPER